MLGIGGGERLKRADRLIVLARFPQAEALRVGVFARIAWPERSRPSRRRRRDRRRASAAVGRGGCGFGGSGTGGAGAASDAGASRGVVQPLLDRGEALLLVGADSRDVGLDPLQPVAVLFRWRKQSLICRSSASSRWSSDMTDDWVAAGSSGKPAVSAGRPLGKTCRWTCCTWRSSRSRRCSGDGGWRCATCRGRRKRDAAPSPRIDHQTRFHEFTPRSVSRDSCSGAA